MFPDTGHHWPHCHRSPLATLVLFSLMKSIPASRNTLLEELNICQNLHFALVGVQKPCSIEAVLRLLLRQGEVKFGEIVVFMMVEASTYFLTYFQFFN